MSEPTDTATLSIPTPFRPVQPGGSAAPNKHQRMRLVEESELDNASTHIAADTEFKGDYISRRAGSGVSVSGAMSGKVSLGPDSIFFLMDGGQAHDCAIEAATVVLAGSFHGSLRANRLEVLPGAEVKGQITYVEAFFHRGSTVEADHTKLMGGEGDVLINAG